MPEDERMDEAESLRREKSGLDQEVEGHVKPRREGLTEDDVEGHVKPRREGLTEDDVEGHVKPRR